jgi:septin family protein
MQDLKDVTHDVHYENYRVQCLSDLTQLQQHGGSGRLAQIAAAKSTEVLDSPSGRSKLKRDSFVGGKIDDRNRSTEQLLQEKDDEIRKMRKCYNKCSRNWKTKTTINFLSS